MNKDNEQTEKKPTKQTKPTSTVNLAGSLTAPPDVIEFHNKHCKMMIEGRRPVKDDGNGKRVAAIIGLRAFASITKTILKCASADDPYADWFLYRLEEVGQLREQDFLDIEREVNELLVDAPSGIKLDSAFSTDPTVFEIRWGNNAYAYKAAYLLKKFDQLLNVVWMARSKAIINRPQFDKFNEVSMKRMRGYFSVISEFRHMGLTRKDVQQKNQIYKKALDHYRFELDEKIISRELRGEFAPNINPALLEQDESALFGAEEDAVFG